MIARQDRLEISPKAGGAQKEKYKRAFKFGALKNIIILL